MSFAQVLYALFAVGVFGLVCAGYVPLLLLRFLPERWFEPKPPEFEGCYTYREQPSLRQPSIPRLGRWRNSLRAYVTRFPSQGMLALACGCIGVSIVVGTIKSWIVYLEGRAELAHTAIYKVTDRSWESTMILCEDQGQSCATVVEDRKGGSDDHVTFSDDVRFTQASPGERVQRRSRCLVYFQFFSSSIGEPYIEIPDRQLGATKKIPADTYELVISPCRDQLAGYPLGSIWEVKVKGSGLVRFDTLTRIRLGAGPSSSSLPYSYAPAP
jgi:hypothetical protein